MKKFLLIIVLFFFSNNSFSKEIVFLDVQFIIDNSEVGKYYKEKILVIEKEKNINLEIMESKIKEKENEINKQKNIMSKNEIDKRIADLNKLVKEYKSKRNENFKEVVEKKKNYTSKILKILNPLLTRYVEENNINLVVEKKNILLGIKTLDITNDLMKILNEEVEQKNLLNEN